MKSPPLSNLAAGWAAALIPEDKRPNLESMVKKALRGSDYSVHYHAAINSQTLRNAAKALRS
jgi:[acyl-carrier-protein] S-malonyltransferase